MISQASEIAPIFIVGSPRSGTTLLRFMLSSHSRIYVPDETGFIPYLVKPSRVSKYLSQDDVHFILKRIASLNYLWTDLVVDISAFYQNDSQRKNLGTKAEQYATRNTGATKQLINRWEPLFNSSGQN